uniref:Uncharacterized protein n=1 Tax=Gossypium raimondii TaxID=29730 RepID=A0A0D2SFS7_GOSRA|nr:hypothetical protein B456_013G172600 [Gossypium raimondii]
MKQTASDFSISSLCYFLRVHRTDPSLPSPDSSISVIFHHCSGLPVLSPCVVPLPSNMVVHHTSVLPTPIYVPLYWLLLRLVS